MAITVGNPAVTADGGSGSYTIFDATTPANATGTIDHIEVFVDGTQNFEFALFYLVSGSVFSSRSNTNPINLTSGLQELDAPGDFTALAVEINDMIGIYPDDIDRTAGGAGDTTYVSGDNIPMDEVTCTTGYNTTYSLLGEGTESGGVVAPTGTLYGPFYGPLRGVI